METDEGPLINENSNGLSHLLTDGEFSGVDAAVDESSASNQGFLNAVELSAGSVGDYLESNVEGYNTDSFDVGDIAVNFRTDSLDGDSRLSAGFKLNDYNESDSKLQNDSELSNGDYPANESMECNFDNNEECNMIIQNKDNSKSCENADSGNQNSTTENINSVKTDDIETNKTPTQVITQLKYLQTFAQIIINS